MELSDIPQELLIARGQFATVRGAHEDAKQKLSVLCGSLSATASQVLRAMQPDNDAAPDMLAVAALLKEGRDTLAGMGVCAAMIAELAQQRATLKPQAWPKR